MVSTIFKKKEILFKDPVEDNEDDLYGDKKIPSMKELSIEYDEVLAKKKALYSEYRTAKEEMKKYQTAKYDIDKILNMDLEGNRKKEERQKKRETSL